MSGIVSFAGRSGCDWSLSGLFATTLTPASSSTYLGSSIVRERLPVTWPLTRPHHHRTGTTPAVTMNNHADSAHTLSFEESITLLDEKSPSDIESDAGRADLASRFPPSLARRARALLLRTTLFLLPSFLHPSPSNHRPPTLSPTAYLDGVRGIAALVVFICHYTYSMLNSRPNPFYPHHRSVHLGLTTPSPPSIPSACIPRQALN